jgi:hypothetical protein
MRSAVQAWKKRVDGAFGGTLLHVIGSRIVCKIYREQESAMWCLHDNGKYAWERVFEGDDFDHYLPLAERIYVDGRTARRLDPATGQTLASKDLGDVVSIQPSPSRGIAYVVGGIGAPKALVGLDPYTLNVVWRWPDPNYFVHGEQLCRYAHGAMNFVDLATMLERAVPYSPALGIHGHCGDLWCHFEPRKRIGISTATGEVVWQHEEAEDGLQAGLTYANDVAYCGGRAMSAYDLNTGKVLWRRVVDGNPGRLRVEGGRVYAGTKSGLLYTLDGRTGEVLLAHDLKAEPTAIAPLAPNRIVVGTYKVIYCLEWS